jgi:hypothetical protein
MRARELSPACRNHCYLELPGIKILTSKVAAATRPVFVVSGRHKPYRLKISPRVGR